MMRKLVLIIMLAVMAAACGPSPTPSPASTTTQEEQATPDDQIAEATETVVAVAKATATVEPAPDDSAEIEDDAANSDLASSGYQMSSTIIDAGQVKESDWVKGNPDARVTIVEYGDFQ